MPGVDQRSQGQVDKVQNVTRQMMTSDKLRLNKRIYTVNAFNPFKIGNKISRD